MLDMTTFSWLHLTDLHLGMSDQAGLLPNVEADFLNDLAKLYDKCGPWDLVLFTGDLTYKGSEDEFVNVNHLLERLWKRLQDLGSNPVLLAVPGNHDLVRPNEEWLEIDALRRWDNETEHQEEFWRNSMDRRRQVVDRSLFNYMNWWQTCTLPRPNNFEPGILPGDFSAILEKDGVTLGVVGLNSTFAQLDKGDYTQKLVLGAKQFHQACGGNGSSWCEARDIRMLLTHQPPEWLTPGALQTYNSEVFRPGLFDVHLFGHLHEPRYRVVGEGGASPRRTWQGTSLFGLDHWGESPNRQVRQHGYSAGHLTVEAETISIRFWPRKADQQQAGHLRLVPDHTFNLEDDQGTKPERDLVRHRTAKATRTQRALVGFVGPTPHNSFYWGSFLAHAIHPLDKRSNPYYQILPRVCGESLEECLAQLRALRALNRHDLAALVLAPPAGLPTEKERRDNYVDAIEAELCAFTADGVHVIVIDRHLPLGTLPTTIQPGQAHWSERHAGDPDAQKVPRLAREPRAYRAPVHWLGAPDEAMAQAMTTHIIEKMQQLWGKEQAPLNRLAIAMDDLRLTPADRRMASARAILEQALREQYALRKTEFQMAMLTDGRYLRHAKLDFGQLKGDRIRWRPRARANDERGLPCPSCLRRSCYCC